MIRNIVFDMGMVLLNWKPMLPCLRCTDGDTEKARQLCEAVFLNPDWGRIIDGGLMDEEAYFDFCRQRMPSEELRQCATQMQKDWWLDALYPMPGIESVLETLISKGYKLYILSNCGHRFHDFKYKIPHIDAFEGMLVSAEELMLKPDEQIYRRLLDKFGLKAEECVFVDDLIRNVEGARAVGMQGYHHADGDAQKMLAALLSLTNA